MFKAILFKMSALYELLMSFQLPKVRAEDGEKGREVAFRATDGSESALWEGTLFFSVVSL